MSDPVLESSLTEMDWLPRLQVGGSLTGLMEHGSGTPDQVSSKGSVECRVSQAERLQEQQLQYLQQQPMSSSGKPPFSYTNLITSAINSCEDRKMSLSDIYQWIADTYPYYQNAAPGWKNSIRHNLSLNKTFVKVPRQKDDPGKGSYWSLESCRPKDDSLYPRNQQTELQYRGHHPESVQQCVEHRAADFTSACEVETSVSVINELSSEMMLYLNQDGSSADCGIGESFRNMVRSAVDNPLSNEWVTQLDWLKESMKSGFPDDVDIEFLMESMKAIEADNPEQLAASVSQFLAQTSNLFKNGSLDNTAPGTSLPLSLSGSETLIPGPVYDRYQTREASTTRCSSLHYNSSANSIDDLLPPHQVNASNGVPYNTSSQADTRHTNSSFSQYLDDIEDDNFNWDKLL